MRSNDDFHLMTDVARNLFALFGKFLLSTSWTARGIAHGAAKELPLTLLAGRRVVGNMSSRCTFVCQKAG